MVEYKKRTVLNGLQEITSRIIKYKITEKSIEKIAILEPLRDAIVPSIYVYLVHS